MGEARLFEIGEIDRVVDVAHRVAVAEAHLELVREDRRHWRRAVRPGPARLERALGVQALELDLGVIGELHRGGDGAVAGLLGDQRVHPLADAAVGGMPLRRRAQLDDVHRLARVHVHVEAHAVGHRHRVRRQSPHGRSHASRSCSSADASMTRRQRPPPPASTIASGSL